MRTNPLLISALALFVATPRAWAEPNQAKPPPHHVLPATKDNVQWGWFDVNEKPKLTIASGDTVSIETWYHALDQIKPKPGDKGLEGPSMDEIAHLRKENDGGGPHSLTGPIYVEGA